jgi:hypothetical protein
MPWPSTCLPTCLNAISALTVFLTCSACIACHDCLPFCPSACPPAWTPFLPCLSFACSAFIECHGCLPFCPSACPPAWMLFLPCLSFLLVLPVLNVMTVYLFKARLPAHLLNAISALPVFLACSACIACHDCLPFCLLCLSFCLVKHSMPARLSCLSCMPCVSACLHICLSCMLCLSASLLAYLSDCLSVCVLAPLPFLSRLPALPACILFLVLFSEYNYFFF